MNTNDNHCLVLFSIIKLGLGCLKQLSTTPIQNIREIFVWLVYTPFNDTSPIHRIYINSLAPYSLCDWYDLLYTKEEEEDTVYILITFNNISVISWRSVVLLGKPGYQEKTIDLSQVTDKLYHIMLDTSPWSRFELTTSEVIGTDCIGSCKSNYHTITVQPYVIGPMVYIFKDTNSHWKVRMISLI
jgi:hypothetical protein